LQNFVLVLICCRGFCFVEFRPAVAVDSQVIAGSCGCCCFFAVVADKFSADAEVLPLHVVVAPGVDTDGGGFCIVDSTPSEWG